MVISLQWIFNTDFSGFAANQTVQLSREYIEGDWYLTCKSQQSKSTPGVKLKDIIVPNDGAEYCLEVDGFANNKKSFIWVATSKGDRLLKQYIVLPELLGNYQKIKPTCVSFRLQQLNTCEENCSISIGILIGGSSPPTTNDVFFIRKVCLYRRTLDQNFCPLSYDKISVTRVFNSKQELQQDIPHPVRDNGTPMDLGEFAIIRCNDSDLSEDHGNLYVVYQDPELDYAYNLKYICNIRSNHNYLSHSIQLFGNEIIPIYGTEEDALLDVSDESTQSQFYDLFTKNHRKGEITSKDGPTFIYFDDKGYVRWINTRHESPHDLPDELPHESQHELQHDSPHELQHELQPCSPPENTVAPRVSTCELRPHAPPEM